ncbi:MAG: 6-pyruvoyl-tetrahydropterin synthase-related protein [Lacticaseibacillus songhuajiangensis]|nr:6-pyruvoyl-tetrahydropterin synthase-related protein [Lacticaseibacillus songhuajiangensis]
MISSYYPWLTVYPVFLLIKVLGNILLGYRLSIIFFTFLSGLSAYGCARYLRASTNNSLLFAVTYLFSTYHTVNIFLRSAVGEIICAAIVPIVFTALYATLQGRRRAWVVLAIGMTAIVYTHVISVLLTAIMCLALVLPFTHILARHKDRLTAIVKSIVLTLLLSAGFLVPFMQSLRQHSVQLPTPTKLQESASTLSEFMSSAFTNRLTSFTLGVIIILMLLTCLIEFPKLNRISKHLIILSLLMVLLQIHSPVLDLLDFLHLNQIQFIWRLNSFPTLFIPYVFWSDGITVSTDWINSLHTPLLLGLVLLELVFTFISTNYLFNTDTRYFIHGQVTSSQQMVTKLSKYAHGDYRPVGSPSPFDKQQRGQLNLSFSPANARVRATRHDSFVDYRLTANRPNIKLSTGVYSYKNFQVTYNTTTSISRRHGLIFAQSSSNHLHVRVRAVYPRLTRVTWLISLVSFLITVIGLILQPNVTQQISSRQLATSQNFHSARP